MLWFLWPWLFSMAAILSFTPTLINIAREESPRPHLIYFDREERWRRPLRNNNDNISYRYHVVNTRVFQLIFWFLLLLVPTGMIKILYKEIN